MADGEVSLLLTGLRGLGLDEARRFAQMVVVQLVAEGLISGFREHRLFLEDGHNTHGLFDVKQIKRNNRSVIILHYFNSNK